MTADRAQAGSGLVSADGASAWTTGEAPALPFYTFHCRRADGSPVCLEAQELASDDGALVWAQKLLTEHQTCSVVEVFAGERLVGAVPGGPIGSGQSASSSAEGAVGAAAVPSPAASARAERP
ncbi:MAG TPA: hypothetical protein VLI41_00850 [Phenylobacterium sp.]|uniref:hypothetical protein n=1 Tax=Phenylobacterium sp. TaxID=1871053 RepID=UPI002BB52402|nr:hypothetical protein [Phenylobacterium sp.]HSV01727.1 hypothetical protein [Phenylobacterium sp.]